METKDNRKRVAAQIKILASYKAAPDNSNSDVIVKVPRNNTTRNGFLLAHKKKGKKKPKHKGS